MFEYLHSIFTKPYCSMTVFDGVTVVMVVWVVFGFVYCVFIRKIR